MGDFPMSVNEVSTAERGRVLPMKSRAFLLALLLSACGGGGGGGGGDAPPADTTPNPFTFADQTSVTPGATVTSAPVTITGINAAAAISVTGGTYSVGCTGTFTAVSATVTNNQQVCVRHTAAATESTATDTVLTVGGVSDTFRSVTSGPDTTPDAFTFTDQTGVNPGATVTSAPVTITGIAAPATIGVTGGGYSIGCTGTFTASGGTIANNEQVCVRHTASASFAASTNTVLTVGGVTDTFTSTTRSADTTPDAFTFTDQTGVDPATLVTSAPVTITGLEAPASISVAGGGYSIGCTATYTSTAGTVGNNAQVCVRHASSSAYSASTSTTLTVGGVSDTFTSTTRSPPPDTTLTGQVTYDRVYFVAPPGQGLDLDNPVPLPVRAATVQLVRASDSAVLDTDRTDESGLYSVTGPENTQVFVRVRAELQTTGGTPSYDVRVVNNTSGDALYTLVSTQFSLGAAGSNPVRDLHAATGWNGSSYTGTRAAAPFAILDSIHTSMKKVIAVDPAVGFPPLTVKWSTLNQPAQPTSGAICPADGRVGTSYYTQGIICILGSAGNDTDEFDDHVVIHEWAHFFEDNLSRSDSLGGSHSGGERLDMRVAYGEGFGNAWSGIATDDPLYRDSFGAGQASSFTIDVESNFTSNEGWYNEASVQSVIYDLYDAANETGDAVTLGLAPLYSVWVDEQRTSVALTSIFPFAAALKANNPGSASAINAVLADRSISNSDEYGNNETNNAGSGNVLPIYTPITVNGGGVNLCSIGTFGEYNNLGNWRYLRFQVTSAGTHTFTASGTLPADPMLNLHQAGSLTGIVDQNTVANPNESFSRSLSPGFYVLEVADFENFTQDNSVATVCMTVTITR